MRPQIKIRANTASIGKKACASAADERICSIFLICFVIRLLRIYLFKRLASQPAFTVVHVLANK